MGVYNKIWIIYEICKISGNKPSNQPAEKVLLAFEKGMDDEGLAGFVR